MIAITADQRRSQQGEDSVPGLLTALETFELVRRFERTAGDEVQGLCDAPETAVDLVREIAQDGRWWVGVGMGEVERPIPKSVRASRGSALVAARAAVERATKAPAGVAVEAGAGLDPEAVRDVETALQQLARLVADRSAEGKEAVRAMQRFSTQVEAAQELHISAQAMSSRLSVARWGEEARLRELAIRLMSRVPPAAD